LAKDTQANRDHEKEAFQAEKEDLLCYLEQVRAEANKKIIELKDQVREEVSLFKHVKYEQGYIDWAQGKPLRYPLEGDI